MSRQDFGENGLFKKIPHFFELHSALRLAAVPLRGFREENPKAPPTGGASGCVLCVLGGRNRIGEVFPFADCKNTGGIFLNRVFGMNFL